MKTTSSKGTAIHDPQCLTHNKGREGGFYCVCTAWNAVTAPDNVNHPAHYTAHPSGVECIAIVESMTFNVGNAVKYCWRAGLKSPDAIQDLKKARWYIDREIGRLSNGQEHEAKEHGASSRPTEG